MKFKYNVRKMEGNNGGYQTSRIVEFPGGSTPADPHFIGGLLPNPHKGKGSVSGPTA